MGARPFTGVRGTRDDLQNQKWNGKGPCLHFAGGETEAEEGDVTCLKNAGIRTPHLGPELGSVVSEAEETVKRVSVGAGPGQ